MEHGLEEHLAGIFPEEGQPQNKAQTRCRAPLWDPPVKRKVKRSQRQTRASTVGSLKLVASTGRQFDGATSEWRISG
jgi:hypothetical protein